MKRAIAAIFLLALFAIGVSSCGSGEKCPTYGQVEKAEVPA